MNFKNLFQSSDSKYFLKTAFKFASVSFLVTTFLCYSFWLYMNLNYSFFLSQGFFNSPDFKEVFWDRILSGQLNFIVLLGLYFVAMFFIGMLMAHFILRPFNQVAKAFRQFQNDIDFDFKIDKISEQKVVIQAAQLLIQFIKLKKSDALNEFTIPSSLKNINKPQFDKVFYLQYFSLVFIMSSLAILVSYVFATQLHASITESAVSILKSSNEVMTFLVSQLDVIENMIYSASILCISMFVFLSRGIIKDIEGVSFGYLRDIKDIVQGQTQKRLRPRLADPGKEASEMINKTLDLYMSHEQAQLQEKEVIKNPDLPPSFVQKLENQEGATIYKIYTPNGHRIEGLKYEEVVDFIKKVG